MSPVVVLKDFGGYVDQYAVQTDLYRRTGREVRIHECHSACTMGAQPAQRLRLQGLDLQVPPSLRSSQSRHQLGSLERAVQHLSRCRARAAGNPDPRIHDLARDGVDRPRRPRLRGAGPPHHGGAGDAEAAAGDHDVGILGPVAADRSASGHAAKFRCQTGVRPGPAEPRAAHSALVPDEMLRATIPLPPEKPASIATARLGEVETPIPRRSRPWSRARCRCRRRVQKCFSSPTRRACRRSRSCRPSAGRNRSCRRISCRFRRARAERDANATVEAIGSGSGLALRWSVLGPVPFGFLGWSVPFGFPGPSARIGFPSRRCGLLRCRCRPKCLIGLILDAVGRLLAD